MSHCNAQSVMLLTKKLLDNPQGGRELLCRLNYHILRDIFQERLVLFELESRPIKNGRDVMNAFAGYIDGLSRQTIDSALAVIEKERVSKVFVDGSNLGAFVKAVKRKFPDVEVSTFFHNVEARFFLGLLRQTKSLHALAVLVVNYLAERKAVRFSDKIICLSERDSQLLKKVYGRGSTHVSPMALQDKLPAGYELSPNPPNEKYALFVGGGFYANRAGIAWFVKHVVPYIQIKICIVGRGFEDIKHDLEREGKVVVVGAVDSLAEWYRDSQFVIAPIFDGSGMKTKVAEALMFGKKVIGTPEAFSGYEDIVDRAGWVCETAADFAAAIEVVDTMVKERFDTELRSIYESTYSYSAARKRMENIIGG